MKGHGVIAQTDTAVTQNVYGAKYINKTFKRTNVNIDQHRLLMARDKTRIPTISCTVYLLNAHTCFAMHTHTHTHTHAQIEKHQTELAYLFNCYK